VPIDDRRPRQFRLVTTAVALIVLVVCALGVMQLFSGSSPTDLARSSASLTVGNDTSFRVGSTNLAGLTPHCTRVGKETYATAQRGSDSVTMIVTGKTISAALSVRSTDGSLQIYQAAPGLRGSSGNLVRPLRVREAGNTYTGSGSFALTKINKHGIDEKLTSGVNFPGNFNLSCSHGYSSVAPPSTNAKSSLNGWRSAEPAQK